MRRATSFALPLVLSLCYAAPEANAQRRRGARARRDAPAAAAATPERAVKGRAQIIEEVNAEDGVSTRTVRLVSMPLEGAGSARHQSMLGADFSYEGANPAATKFVALYFHSLSPECRFPPKSDLTLLADGAPLKLAFQPDATASEGVRWVSGEREESAEGAKVPCAEMLAAFLSPKTFARIVKARAVEAKVGTTSMRLNDEHMKALRELAAHLDAPGGAGTANRR